MKRGFAIAIVYLVLILMPVAIVAILSRRSSRRATTWSTTCPPTRTDLQDFVAENDTLRRLQRDYDITGELEKQAAQLPGRAGDAAGMLSDIGLGLVNSIFQA